MMSCVHFGQAARFPRQHRKFIPMAMAAGYQHPPWRIGARSGCGGRPGPAEMEASPSWRPTICARNAERDWRSEFLACRVFVGSSGRTRPGRRAAAPRFSAHDAQTMANPNSILSTRSRNFAAALRGKVDSIHLRRGATVIKGSKSGGETEAEGHNAPTRDTGNTLLTSRNLGRRAAILFGGSTLWSGLGCCRNCEQAVAVENWDYGGPSGPAKWEGLCSRGSKQSPVDITSTNTKDGGSLGVLNFLYAPSTVSVKNTGHGTIQVSFGKPDNFLRVRGHSLQLLQFHFHAPSEHAFDGERYPMEAHLVHRDPVTRKIVVVGVMLDASKTASPNECLATSLAYVPQEHGLSVDAPVEVSPSVLLPPASQDGSRGYVHYDGSLTTPPCSEGVEWFVLDTALNIASSQVFEFLQFSGDGHSLAFNSRPLQPLGERTIFKGP